MLTLNADKLLCRVEAGIGWVRAFMEERTALHRALSRGSIWRSLS